jgi:hypothetical protein
MKHKFYSYFIATMLMFVFSILILAQEGVLKGIVKDEQDARLPGVSITITSPSMMGTRTITTDDKGFYRFLNLPPGRYTMEATLEGFTPYKKENIEVRVDRITTENVVLRIGGVAETITVRAETPLIDVEKADQSFTVDKFALGNLPLAPRLRAQDVWLMLPGVTQYEEETSRLWGSGESPHVNAADLENEGNQQLRWQNDAYESGMYVDGLQMNCSMSGRMYYTMNYEAIEEISIKSGGYEAEYGTARAGQMHIITKSGGNEFHGNFQLLYQPKSFNWANIEGSTSVQDSYTEPAFTISGPIKRDRIWFMGSTKIYNQDHGYENVRWEDQIIQNTRGYPSYGKVSWQFNPNHRMFATVSTDRYDMKNSGSGRPERDTYDALRTLERGGYTYSGSYTAVLGADSIFEAMVGFHKLAVNTVAQEEGAQYNYYDTYRGAVEKYDNNYEQDYISWRQGIHGTFTYSWIPTDLAGTGSHEFKFGTELRPKNYITRSRDYHHTNFGVTQGLDGGFYIMEYALDYANYGLTEPYLWQAYSKRPSGYYINEVINHLYSIYAQDSWNVTDNLTLNLGVRWDYADLYMLYRDEMPAWLDMLYPYIRDNMEFQDNGFSPRVGFAYNLGDNGVIRSSFGRFFEFVGTGDYNNYSRELSTDTWRVDPSDFGGGPEALYLYRYGADPTNPNYNDRNLRMEYNWKWTLGYERSLPGDLAIEVFYMYQRHYPLEGEDINAIFSADGRFIGRVWPQWDTVTRREWFSGDERRRLFLYHTIQLTMRRNFTNKGGLNANFSYFWRKEDFFKFGPGNPYQFVYTNPDDADRINYGYRWVFKVSAFYLLPYDISLSAFFNAQSGRTFASNSGNYDYYADPPGVTLSNGRVVDDIVWEAFNSYYAGGRYGAVSRTSDPTFLFNVRFQKDFNYEKYSFQAALDFFNLFNWSTYRNWRAHDIRDRNYDLQTTPQAPRAAQLSFRFIF